MPSSSGEYPARVRAARRLAPAARRPRRARVHPTHVATKDHPRRDAIGASWSLRRRAPHPMHGSARYRRQDRRDGPFFAASRIRCTTAGSDSPAGGRARQMADPPQQPEGRAQAVQLEGAAGGAERAHSDVRKRAPDGPTRQMGRISAAGQRKTGGACPIGTPGRREGGWNLRVAFRPLRYAWHVHPRATERLRNPHLRRVARGTPRNVAPGPSSGHIRRAKPGSMSQSAA